MSSDEDRNLTLETIKIDAQNILNDLLPETSEDRYLKAYEDSCKWKTTKDMPLTGAERQRRYLQKLKNNNPEKLEELKKKNLEQTKRKYRKVNDLNERERELQRQKWRKQKQNRNNKEVPKELAKKTEENEKRKFRYRLKKDNSNLKSTIKLLTAKIRSLKKCVYRYKKQVKHLEEMVITLKPPIQKENNVNVNIIDENKQTPYSKTEKFMQEIVPQIATPEKNMIKKVLFENIVMKESLSMQYSQATSNHERDTLKKVINNDITTKYKMKTNLSSTIGLKGRIRSRKSLKERKICRLKELNDFLSRDDNSRASAGKKEYRTLHKKRVQVRYLLDTMKNLHTKYKSEGGKLSYAMFTRYKPFYIISPKLADRNTCACIKHANLSFMANKLKQLKVIESNNLTQLVSTIACNVNDPKCMYGECNKCSKKDVNYDITNRNLNDLISWKRWVTKKHEFKKNENQEKKTITKRTVKEEITQSLETLLHTFCDQLRFFRTHHFNITHQYKMYKKCKDNLSEHEILLHCDFSENYVCKLAEEVQALHFGASKRQISLHTGVVYAKYQDALQTTSFCTISPNTNHSPGAIWAHLTPILQLIKEKYPKVTILHFYSDGPTTQYRQKKNFYMINKMISKLGFQKATWSFFEASHGKGAADGIGGAAKRNLDRYVTHGEDIPDAESAYNALIKSNSNIKYFYIPDKNIDTIIKDLDSTSKDIIPVPNTMSIHQVISVPNTDIIKFRKLSCFCGVTSGHCACFDVKEHNLKQKRNEKSREMKGTLKTVKRQKIEKTNIRSIQTDDSDTSVESEIDYAESDDSIWDGGEDLDCEYGYDENLKENQIEKSKEANFVINKKTEKKVECNSRKVTILTDIRNSPENCRYFNLNNYGPFTLKPIDKHFLVNKANMKNIYENPMPSTSSINNDNSVREYNITEGDIEEVLAKEKEIDGCYFDPNSINKIEKNISAVRKEEIKTEKVTKIQNEMIEEIYNVNDSVLIRYYERKFWVYYIGFIEGVEMRTQEIHYRVRFLKTVKKPELKFTIPKKPDIDTVPSGCVVKVINLKFASHGFMLTDDGDQIYF